MLDKQLTETAWKTFSKGKDFKDAALLKALASLQKAEKDGPQALLDALDEPSKQAKALRAAHKGDKELAAWLDKFDKALEGERDAAEKALAEAADADADDDDDDSPAVLSSKLVVMLRQVRNGEPASALIALGAKQTLVLLSRKPVGATQQRLMKQQLDGGSVKFLTAQCLYEANAHTFVLEPRPSGLVKKLKQALIEQIQQRMKLRVRGQDPTDVEEDLEEGETAPDDAGHDDPMKAQWQLRAAELEPAVLQALKRDAPEAGRIRAVWGFARQKAEAGDFGAALKGLDALTPLLQGTPGGGGAALQTALQAWRTERDAVVARLREMAKVVAESGDPHVDKALIELKAVFMQLRGDPGTEQQVREMETWLHDDPLVSGLCDAVEDLRSPMLATLQALRRALQGAGN